MLITWFGHAAFGVEGTNDDGDDVRIVLDPYNHPDCGGYSPVDVEADIVSVSHENIRYHSDTSSIRGEFVLLNGLHYAGSPRMAHGVAFEAIEVYEDDQGEGPNAMVKFTLEGIRIAHQGDLGHAIEGKALEFLRGTDVLLALAGGAPTIGLGDLRALVDEIQPSLIVPMHYKTPKVNLSILPIGKFLDAFEGYPVVIRDAVVEVNGETLPLEPTVWTMAHAR